MARIGVFVCHCGENIAGTVDVGEVVRAASEMEGVAYAAEHKFMCSDPGQDLIRGAIREHNLTGLVVAACSPAMHERTFRKTAASSGLNPYLVEIANIREQCSWVHEDRELATEKAIELVRIVVEKVKRNHPLEPMKVPITKRALVIGGGIAGIQAALDVADGGHEVILVEREPSIGGHMAQLSETFPTLDCSQCILTPKMVDASTHENITLYTYSEVEEVSGYIGNFEVKIRKKARSVDPELCTGCGVCWNKCPTKRIPSEFECGLGERTAIYVPFPQAVPNVPVIDRSACLYYTKGRCRICEKSCPTGAIRFDQEDEIVTEKVGAIILAIGYKLYSIAKRSGDDRYEGYGEYGYGRYEDVVDGLQFERLLSSGGPTGGELKRPSDGKVPKEVVFIQCVGSRHDSKGIEYCSKICCMYTAKHAMLYKHKVPDGQAYIFYMDIRAPGKGYEEFVRRAVEEDGAVYLRGRVSRIYREDGKLIVYGADTLSGTKVEIAADMVVLATAVQAQEDADRLARMLGVPYDEHMFYSEAHPKLRPVETNTAGVLLAGACQGPKDIPESVAQASAAASKVLAIFSADEMEREPTVASVNEDTCVACFYCKRVCPYNAISEKEIRDRDGRLKKIVAEVNSGLCTGCGLCVATCPSKSMELEGFTDEQLYAQINALGG